MEIVPGGWVLVGRRRSVSWLAVGRMLLLFRCRSCCCSAAAAAAAVADLVAGYCCCCGAAA
eukprot:scaffold109411_cov33-Cyclotella_meneghiniana.AAC.1